MNAKQRDTAAPTANGTAGIGSSPIGRLFRYLDWIGGTLFYGRVTITFQAGKVCDVKVEQTYKLEEL